MSLQRTAQIIMELQLDLIKVERGNPYHDREGKFTTGPGGLVVYHGTQNPGFEHFNPAMGNSTIISRAIGVHVSEDPQISNTFTDTAFVGVSQGGLYRLKIPQNAKFLTVKQDLHPYLPLGTAKAPSRVEGDDWAVEHLVMYHVYRKDPSLLATYLEQARAVPKQDALKLAEDLAAGKKVTLPVDGPGFDLDRLLINFGGAPYNDRDKIKAAKMFREDMQAAGYTGLKYINTSPMETKHAKNHFSYIQP